MKTGDNESRLSRWSRRKQQTQAETLQEDLATDLLLQSDSALLSESTASDETNSIQTAPDQPEPEQPALTDADMPAIDTLNSESDFSMFMSSGVTDKLRNLALKQLFKAPHFNIRDGLDEYDEDYTFFEKLGDIVTCDMKHQIEVEELKKAAAKLEADKNSVLNDEDEDEDEDALLEEDSHEENLEDPLEDDSPDSVQEESDIETNEIELNPKGLDQMPLKPESVEGSVITKGEVS
ncbi:MAG: hypothetical protein ACI823_002442 [Chitinophagales bacterium]|jgi:hypothetical protein